MKKTKKKTHWLIDSELFKKISELAQKEKRSITQQANILLQKGLECLKK